MLSPAIGTAWNLAFGDASGEGDDFDDEAISNNGDMKVVLQTLANIIYDFLSEHPDFEVVIHPVDDRRQILYNRIIHQNFDLISSELNLIGVINKYAEPIRLPPIKNYDLFIISLKTANFGKNLGL